jgi:hypothetical protein
MPPNKKPPHTIQILLSPSQILFKRNCDPEIDLIALRDVQTQEKKEEEDCVVINNHTVGKNQLDGV